MQEREKKATISESQQIKHMERVHIWKTKDN